MHQKPAQKSRRALTRALVMFHDYETTLYFHPYPVETENDRPLPPV